MSRFWRRAFRRVLRYLCLTFIFAGDVFSVDVGPVYGASGGEDDRAYVWRLQDGESVFECTGIYFIMRN